VPHPELAEPAAWWKHVEAVLAGAYRSSGISALRADELARLAHRRYIDTAEAWKVYADALPALRRLSSMGWRHAILSNHVPELPDIVSGLGLAPHFEAVFTSAETGFEKPHAQAFARARGALGDPASIWMIGDNPSADVAGARAAGIPAILVRGRRDDAVGLGALPELLSAAEHSQVAVQRSSG
jgi:putative hydrolase of the HAD superfamily